MAFGVAVGGGVPNRDMVAWPHSLSSAFLLSADRETSFVHFCLRYLRAACRLALSSTIDTCKEGGRWHHRLSLSHSTCLMSSPTGSKRPQ